MLVKHQAGNGSVVLGSGVVILVISTKFGAATLYRSYLSSAKRFCKNDNLSVLH